MKMRLKVGLAQYLNGREPAEIVKIARGCGAGYRCLPEMYSSGYARFDPDDPAAKARWCAGAHSLESDFVDSFREAAKTHRMHVVTTFLEAAEPKPFNTALLIDPAGSPVLHHRKVHIFAISTAPKLC